MHTFLKVILIVVFIILAACESTGTESAAIHNESNNNIVPKKTEKTVERELSGQNDNKEQAEAAEQPVAEKYDKHPSEPKESIHITSGEDAVQHLKQHLKEGENDDISFGTDGKLETDHIGSYYTIQLVDIPLRVSGKTGNLGYYKVYQDGTYEQFQINSSHSDSDMTKNDQEKYLKQLHDIEKEMASLQKDSEAITTREMEEDATYQYQMWDTALNDIYDVLKEQLNQEQMDQLREEQQNWITYRDEMAKKASLKYEGGSMASIEYVSTQATLTKERCYTLVEKYMT